MQPQRPSMRYPIRVPILVALSLLVGVADVAVAQSDAADKAGGQFNAAEAPFNPFGRRDAFVGLYEDRDMAVQILAANTGLTGSIAMAGVVAPITAERRGDQLEGTFRYRGVDFTFTAQLDADVLTLTTGDATYTLHRQRGRAMIEGVAPATAHAVAPVRTAPVAPQPQRTVRVEPPVRPPVARTPVQPVPQPSPSPPVDASKPGVQKPRVDPAPPTTVSASNPKPKPTFDRSVSPVATGPEMQVQQSSSGLSLRFPKAWRIHTGRLGSFLLDDDVERGPDGRPRDVIQLGQRAEPKVSDVQDPANLDYFDRYVQARWPALKRQAEAQRLDTLLGPGLAIRYAGALQDSSDALVTVYATLHESRLTYLVHAVHKAVQHRREPIVRQVFSSMGWGLGATDSNLVGAWGALDQSSSRATTWQFGDQGACVRSSKAANGSARHEHGTWYSDNGTLKIVWRDGGAEVFDYAIEPTPTGDPELRLTPTEGRSFLLRSLK